MCNESAQHANHLWHSIKAKKAPGFTKPAMIHKVMQILEQHHFRLPVCRFVLDLFDRSVLRQIVLEEEDDDDEEADDVGDEEGEESESEEESSDDDHEDEENDNDDSDDDDDSSDSESLVGQAQTTGVP